MVNLVSQRRSLPAVGRLIWAILFLCFSGVVLADESVEADRSITEYRGKVSDLRVDAKVLGAEWTGPTGLIIDDFDDPTNLLEPERTEAPALIAQLSPEKIIACADFNYWKPTKTLPRLVTLRVFLFDSTESASTWWKKKYEHKGWQKYYRKVDGVGDRAVDSTELPKRAALLANVWITCHQINEGDEHSQILSACLDKIRAAPRDDVLTEPNQKSQIKNRKSP